MTDWFFSAAGTVDHLRFVRLAAVIGIVALALLLHWALVRSGIKPLYAALIAVLVCSMPPFQVYALLDAALQRPVRSARRRRRVALASPQSTGRGDSDRPARRRNGAAARGAAHLPADRDVLLGLPRGRARRRGAGPRRACRLVRAHFGVAAVALAIAFVVIKVDGSHSRVDTRPEPPATRSSHDFGGKIHWFFRLPLYHALNLST